MMLDLAVGSGVFVIAVLCIACGYCLHMWHVFRDIAKQEAEEKADKMFDEYIHNCKYRIYTKYYILDEINKK